VQARRDAPREIGKVGRRGERHGEDGRKGRGLGSRLRNLGNRQGVLGFHLQGAEWWPRHGWTGLLVVG